ncbi:MAG: prenyltransferase/squalene oxidase repeat-containing protein, partial [Candidatus Thorarchaeota archaeon]
GFLNNPKATNATITSTYFAIQALDRTNETSNVDTESLYDFIINLQLTNATDYPDTVGSFVNQINGSATVSSTFFAISTLETFDHSQLGLINESLAIAWLNSSQLLDDSSSPSYGGFVNGFNTTTADLQTTFMAVRSLEILGALSLIDQTAVINYVLPHYRENTNYPQFYGGFSLTPDDPVATHWATYYAVATLQILGAENQLATEDIIAWVLSTQTSDGGFADVTGSTGFAPQTNLAISTLALLDQLPALQEPFGPDLYAFPWWIVGVVVLVIVIILFVIIARRADWF